MWGEQAVKFVSEHQVSFIFKANLTSVLKSGDWNPPFGTQLFLMSLPWLTQAGKRHLYSFSLTLIKCIVLEVNHWKIQTPPMEWNYYVQKTMFYFFLMGKEKKKENSTIFTVAIVLSIATLAIMSMINIYIMNMKISSTVHLELITQT